MALQKSLTLVSPKNSLDLRSAPLKDYLPDVSKRRSFWQALKSKTKLQQKAKQIPMEFKQMAALRNLWFKVALEKSYMHEKNHLNEALFEMRAHANNVNKRFTNKKEQVKTAFREDLRIVESEVTTMTYVLDVKTSMKAAKLELRTSML